MPRKKTRAPWTPGTDAKARMTKAEQIRHTFLGLIADGMSVKKACEVVQRSQNWYEKTRVNHPDWARNVTSARLALRDPSLAGMNFVEFRELYFGYHTPPHQYRMIEAFELAKPGSMTACLAFPGAGKSTLLVDRYCYDLAENPNNRICVISEGQNLSRALIGQVSDRMSDRDRFLAYHLRYGPFRARAWDDNDRADRDPLKRPWTADYFKILAADADQKDPSLASFGATSRIYGARFDLMIYDDIQSNETLANTDKYLQSMKTSWSSRTNLGNGERGSSIMIGSRVGPGDIYERMDDLGMIDTLITIPVMDRNIPVEEHYVRINKKIVANPDCTAVPTWETMSLQQLAEVRAFCGEEVWARTWMQDALAETSSIFTEQMIEDAKDRDRVLGKTNAGTETWCSLDPALDSGYCAYMAAAITPSELIVLESMCRTDTRTFTDSFDWVNNWSSKYRPSMWIVEENNYQKGLLQDDRLDTIARRHRFEVESHRTGRNKNDHVMGVRMMANAFADKEIRIPWGDEHTRTQMAPLIHELRTWKPNKRGALLKQDRVMSLWFLWMRWQAERDALNNVIPLMPRPTWVRSA